MIYYFRNFLWYFFNWLFCSFRYGVKLAKILINMVDGINALRHMGELLGKNNIIYRHAIDGINSGMNTDIEPAFSDDFLFEAFVAEAIIQNLKAGYYIDITDVKRNFKHEHFRNIVIDYASKYNIQ